MTSFAYYELNDNLVSDHRYDANSQQLLAMMNEFPKDFSESRYYEYFKDFDGNTGFDLIGKLEKNPETHRIIQYEAKSMIRYRREKKHGGSDEKSS